MRKQEAPNRLRELREAREEKLYDIASALRVDPSTVYRWETGQSPIPDDRKLALAEHFAVSRVFLMGWDLESSPGTERAA